MSTDKTKKEALRKKSLGELGELIGIKVLVDNKFEKIKNLNDIKMNYPFADLIAEKDEKKYVISIKARNKYQKNGDLNSRYKLGNNVFKNAKYAEDEFGAEAYWMAIQFDEKTYTVYFGSLKELDNKKGISIIQCQKESIGECLVKDARHYFDFSYFSNRE